MYAATHIGSDIADNKGSCQRYAKYLSKENTHFFSSELDKIELDEAVEMIDKHSVGGLKKDEAKWYAPMYSFSEKESTEIAKKLFGRTIIDSEEMSIKELQLFKKEIINYARDFQDAMAQNFNKEDLGIISGKDLMYVGVVELERSYKGFEEAVKKGLKKAGEKKEGLNVHIHIIQSRKANNEKKSKISPEAKQKFRKSNLGGTMGFDRNEFYKKVEKKLDDRLSYKRDIKETFVYKKQAKKLNDLSNPYQIGLDKKIRALEKEIIQEVDAISSGSRKKEFIGSRELKNILTKSNLVNYFFILEKKGIVKFDKRIGEDYYFSEVGKENSSRISVSEKGWRDFKQYTGGGIIKAVELYEQKTWLEAVHTLRDTFIDKKTVSVKKLYLQDVEVIKAGQVTRNYLYNSFIEMGISEKIIKSALLQVTYKNPKTEKISLSIGMRTKKGFFVANKYSGNNIGDKSISVIEGNSNVFVFKTMQEYLAFLQYHNVTSMAETVVVLHEIQNLEEAKSYLNEQKFGNIYTTIDNKELYDKNVKLISADGKMGYDDYLRLETLKKQIQSF